jgi:hypothetical protein
MNLKEDVKRASRDGVAGRLIAAIVTKGLVLPNSGGKYSHSQSLEELAVPFPRPFGPITFICSSQPLPMFYDGVSNA